MSTDSNQPHPNAYNYFIRWYVMPPNERLPKTKEEFYSLMGINESIVGEYQERDTYTDDLYKAASNWGKSKVPELLHMLYDEFKATKKSTHLETYKKLLEIDKDKGITINNFNTLNPTDEQYRQILTRETRYVESSGEETPSQLLPAHQ